MNLHELEKRYMNICQTDGVKIDLIKEVEKELDVIFPKDFTYISKFFSGGYFGGISNHSFSRGNGADNIIDETLRIREAINLPKRFIVLAEPPESIIVLDTQGKPAVIWCDAVEVKKLDAYSFDSEPDVWESYKDYFLQLVEDEEDELY